MISNNKFSLFLCIAVCLASLISCIGKNNDQNIPILDYDTEQQNSVVKLNNDEIQIYFTDILSLRNSTKEYLKSKNSPLIDKDKKNFDGLNYYPVNINYLIEAAFTEFAEKDTVIILTSKDKERQMLRAGIFEFTVDSKKQKLTAFLSVGFGDQSLFLPFLDITSETDTYKAGRYLDIEYLDIEFTGEQMYLIDFNQAYNPYCAYNAKYSCPLVPFENTLNVEILAGEKKYKK